MIDHAVKDISSSRPKLREDVVFSPRVEDDQTIYLMEDLLTGKFFQLGEREYSLIRGLDGRRPVNEIIAATVSGPTATGLSEQDAVSLLRMLSESNLLESNSNDHSRRMRTDTERRGDPEKALGNAKSVFFVKIPLMNPDRFFTKANHVLRRVPGAVFFLIWLFVFGAGILTYLEHDSRFNEEAAGLLQIENFALFGLVWLGLKVVHEFCHGIVCKRFGGNVPEAGFSLLLFVTPLAYVDASTSLRFSAKSRRILVAAAGILGEFFVAAIALLVWAHIAPGKTGAVLHQVVMISTVTTVLFNANPLMKFDGYYILSDLLGISNLYSKGQQSVHYGLKRWVFGIRKASKPLREGEKKKPIIVAYGIASAIWKITVTIGIFAAAIVCLKGAGIIPAVLVALAAGYGAIRKVAKYLRRSAASEETGFWKVSLRIGTIACLLVAFLTLVKITPGIKVPGVVDSGRESGARVECPGFVSEVFVKNGQSVSKGDLLLRLENKSAVLSLKSLESELEQSIIRSNLYFSQENVSAYQAEERNLSGLRTRLTDMQAYLATLEHRAPGDGIVYGKSLAELPGTFLKEGDVATRVIDPGNREILLAIPQEEMRSLRGVDEGDQLEIFTISTGKMAHARLKRINPGASLTSPHPALVSSGGGPLIVRKTTAPAGKNSEELVVPHFLAYATIENDSEFEIQEGQTIWGRLTGQESQSLGSLLSGKFANWLATVTQIRGGTP